MPLDSTIISSVPPPVDIDRGGDERPRRENPVLTPSLLHIEHQTREIWRGMITIRYEIMSLWDWCYMTVTERDDPKQIALLRESDYPIVRGARVGSDTYKEWLRLWHPLGEILPHIIWGGHLKSTRSGDGGKGYAVWKLHALTLT